MLGDISPMNQWQNSGLLGGDDGLQPEDWRRYGVPDLGAYADRMGIMSCEGIGLAAEVDYEVIDGQVAARTPMLELAPEDYQHMARTGRPYDGMMALGDTGAVYEWDGDLGFFSKIVSAAKSVVKKVGSAAKRVIKKLPGGKYLIKLGSKIYKVASKLVKPLVKYVGKYATKLAPVAALIPGYGPAIAAALYTAGKVAKLMKKYGVTYKGKKGGVRKLKFKSGSSAKKFQKALKKQAKKAKKLQKKKQRKKAISRAIAKAKKRWMKKHGINGMDGMGAPPFVRGRSRRIRRRRVGPPRRRRPLVPLRPLARRRRRMVRMARRGLIPPVWR